MNLEQNSLIQRTDRFLSDGLLGFLALVSLFLGLIPNVFNLAPPGRLLAGSAEIAIIALFALEYGVALTQAPSRSAFIRNPWRILDAMIIVAGILSLTPAAVALLRNSPALRLIRFVRLALYGTRTRNALTARSTDSGLLPLESSKPLESFALNVRPTLGFSSVSWEEVIKRIDSLQEDWLLVSNVTRDDLTPIADAFGVPETTLRTRLYDSPFPRIDQMEHYTTLFAWYPSIHQSDENESFTVSRVGILLVGSMHNVVVLTRGQTELAMEIDKRLVDSDTGMPVLVRATHALLKTIIRRYARINDHLETALMQIETNQSALNDQKFLDRTFRLRGEITRVRGSLKHLSQVLRRMADQPIAIKGFESTTRPTFAVLADDAENLYESVDDLMASLGMLVDLRLNVSSFQMNKVMRVLAVLTALALIPGVTGGLLGMNLSGNPWSPTLSQVSFGVGVGMSLCLYVFAVKGWLR